MENLPEPDTRENYTSKELDKWLQIYPKDNSLHQEAGFITGVVSEWKVTGNEELAVRKLWRRHFQTEGRVSEVASTVLNQSAMWFCIEANAPYGLDWQIMNQEQEKFNSNF